MEWQPIETAPKEGCFLAYDKSIGVCILERYEFEGKYNSVVNEIGGGAGEYDDDEVTHWMPLPAPPEVK